MNRVIGFCDLRRISHRNHARLPPIPQYGRFLQDQVTCHGRHHPIIASEYYLEPLDSGGGLFPPRRIALMQGSHSRRNGPHPRQPALSLSKGLNGPDAGDGLYVALLDVGGQDEAATGTIVQLANPARDYTICTIVQVIQPPGSEEPTYHAVDVFVDQGTRFFDNPTGDEAGSLAARLCQ